MRGLVLLCCVLGALATPALAYPSGAEGLETRLMAKMGPGAKDWILRQAGRISSSRTISDSAARNAALQYGASETEADALTFLVLMQAERYAHDSVSNVAQTDMSESAARQDVRKAQQNSAITNYAQQSQLSSGDQLANSANGSASVSLLPGGNKKPLTLRTNAPTPDTPAPPGLNLQDAMDRESQLEDLVGDAMKPIGPAQESAVTALP
ncbi:MAG TPA: hypothetical protein VGF56_05330 [Rhizomicrobium sp.]|jgi:hypothetical protein